jgi:hypothetical protein
MPSRQRVSTFKVFLWVLGIVALGAVSVYADDGKNYPGSMCVRFAGPAPVYNNSGIGNPGTTDLLVDCPAVKDATSIRGGWVRVVDLNDNTDARVQCELRSLIRTGSRWTGCGTGWQRSSDIPPVRSIRNTWCSPPSSCPTSSLHLHHYFYSCRIPPADNGNISYITSYQVNEND